eukprot:SAG31_NODE_33727_length_340_cov_1.377593_2_plen_39_part_01
MLRYLQISWDILGYLGYLEIFWRAHRVLERRLRVADRRI